MTRPRILIVDDNPGSRLLLGDLLEAHGYRIDTAADGATALGVIAERRPDVLLLDLLLPDMNGYEVCRRLRREHPGPPVWILVMSGLDADAQTDIGADEPVDERLTKPLDLTRLLTTLATLPGGAGGTDEQDEIPAG